MDTDNLKIQIKTFFGLEEILAEELRKLGGTNVEVKNRAVNCEGDLGFLYKINYSVRTALKILVPVLTFKAWDVDRFYDKLFAFPWDEYMTVDQTFAIDTTIYSDRFNHSQFISLKMKDAIADYFNFKFRKRPNVDTQNPDVKFHLHIDRELVTISLDSSGDALFKRGYRKEQGEAPINEGSCFRNVTISRLGRKRKFPGSNVWFRNFTHRSCDDCDGFTGSIFRKKFGFQNWLNYDAELFQQIKEVRVNRVREFTGKIVGYDLDSNMLHASRINIEAAEMEDVIEVREQDFFESKKELFPLLMVFNPPYDERIEINDDEFYKKIGDTFKKSYPNTLAWLISSDLDAMKKVGLRPSRRIKLYNGKLECRFLQFEMYEGTKKLHKLEGK